MTVFSTAHGWTALETLTAANMRKFIDDNQGLLAVRAIPFLIGDPAGAVLTTGPKGTLEVPFACTITGWTILGNSTGDSVQIDVWKAPYASAPPTVANTITSSDKPKLVAQQKNQNLAVSSTAWTTSVAAGDILAFNVDSVTTCKFAMIGIRAVLA